MNKQTKQTLLVVLVALVAIPVFAGGSPMIDPSLVGVWRWTTADTPVGSISPRAGQDYLLELRDDGTALMTIEGNRIDGAYTADGSTISLTPNNPEEPSWVPGAPGPRLVELLSEARDYQLTGSSLAFETLRGRGSLGFERVE
jgi:hypothetical protein